MVIKSKDFVYSLCTQLVVIKSKDCLYIYRIGKRANSC